VLNLRGRIKQENLEHFFDIFARTDVTNLLQQIGNCTARHDSAAIQPQAADYQTVANLEKKLYF
jgi:hypothetical protein